MLPLQQVVVFVNNGWLEDGSIDWIDAAFPEKIESLFSEMKVEGDDDFEDLNELEDGDNLDGDEKELTRRMRLKYHETTRTAGRLLTTVSPLSRLGFIIT